MTKATLTLKTLGLNGSNEKKEIMMDMSRDEAIMFFKRSNELLLRTLEGSFWQGSSGVVAYIEYDEQQERTPQENKEGALP